MAPALPFDIWSLIAQFIPQAELLKLYSVNSAFFKLVMNELYREVRICHMRDKGTRRFLANMSPVVGTHVRSLLIRPDLFGEITNAKRKSFAKKLWDYIRIRPVGKPKPSRSTTLLRHITSMTEVTDLTIGCRPWDDFLLFNLTTSFSTTIWSAQGSQLRSLSLSIPLEAYSNILVGEPILESLEDLSITLRIVYDHTISKEMFSLIVIFIERHSRSLLSLSVDTPQAKLDTFHFFQTLGRLPHLNKLSIDHPLDHLRPEYATGIDFFLSKHADLLRQFSIRVSDIPANDLLPSPDELFSCPIFLVQLPHLKSLELGLFQRPNTSPRTLITENLVKYLHPMRKTLSRFAICDYVLTFPELKSIVSVFGRRDSESTLQSLQLHVYFLSCDLFDLVSRQLPGLHHLRLHFDNMKSMDDGADIIGDYRLIYQNLYYPQDQYFFRDMANRIYPDWALRHLTLSASFSSKKWEGWRALVEALPSVITFNGLLGDEFAKPHNPSE